MLDGCSSFAAHTSTSSPQKALFIPVNPSLMHVTQDIKLQMKLFCAKGSKLSLVWCHMATMAPRGLNVTYHCFIELLLVICSIHFICATLVKVIEIFWFCYAQMLWNKKWWWLSNCNGTCYRCLLRYLLLCFVGEYNLLIYEKIFYVKCIM